MIRYFNLDSLNVIFLFVLFIVTGAVVLYQGAKGIKYTIMFGLFIISMIGALLSNHLGLSWVFVEATTLTSAYLIFQGQTENSLEATWKYLFLCSIGISIAFVGIIFLLIGSNSVNSLFFNELYAKAGLMQPFWLKLSFVFICIGFGTKIGLAPLHFWLPDAHSEAPSPVSAMLSATLLNSALIVILRYNKLMELADLGNYSHSLLFIMGSLSVIITAVYVFNSANYKRMLAYSSVENMGIISIGVALGGWAAFGAILHLIFHSLIKASLFLTSGNILKIFKTKKVNEIKGLLNIDSKTAWLWIIGGLFIIGSPPSGIFFSKFLIIKQMIISKHYIIAGCFLALILIIGYGIIRAITKMSFTPTDKNTDVKLTYFNYIPQIILLTITVYLAIFMPDFLYVLIERATKCI